MHPDRPKNTPEYADLIANKMTALVEHGAPRDLAERELGERARRWYEEELLDALVD